MRRAFERADSDFSGKIPSDQFSTIAAQASGMQPSEEDLSLVFQHFDKDEDSGINFYEFIDMISFLEGNQQDYEDCLRRAFKKFDRDGSGYISPEELRYVVCNTGEKFSQSEAEELIGMFDINKDGQLSWEEFVTFVKSSIKDQEEEEGEVNEGTEEEEKETTGDKEKTPQHNNVTL
ncbi:hypothetical protein QZH41_006253 [Actinostola sp. cb2023]|nr:hypothetical protein QZH41_006253 [Actinostola sp. cb2023]